MTDAQERSKGIPVIVEGANGGAFMVGAMAAASAPRHTVVVTAPAQPDDCPMLDLGDFPLAPYTTETEAPTAPEQSMDTADDSPTLNLDGFEIGDDDDLESPGITC